MLSAGFQTLDDLKARLMPAAGADETEWDAKLAAVGLAVAQAFGRYCDRAFDRAVDAVDEFAARATAWTLRRYPVESISAMALVDRDGGTAAYDVADARLMKRSGLLEIPYFIGSEDQHLRITYTGGYWLDDGGAQPAGSTALPADVIEAYVAQAQHWAELRGIFSDAAMREGDDRGALATLALLPAVRTLLNPYRRIGGE